MNLPAQKAKKVNNRSIAKMPFLYTKIFDLYTISNQLKVCNIDIYI